MVVNSKKGQTPTQKVCPDCVKRIDDMGLLPRKGSFDKALHTILSFCDKNKKEFKEWKKKIENQQ